MKNTNIMYIKKCRANYNNKCNNMKTLTIIFLKVKMVEITSIKYELNIYKSLLVYNVWFI